MAELEKVPTIPEGMVPKVLQALDRGLMPGTPAYHQALGSGARQRGLTPSNELPPIISGLRDRFSREAQALSKEQQNLDAVGLKMLEHMAGTTAQLEAQQAFARKNAPTHGQARAYGFETNAPTQEVPILGQAYGPGAPVPLETAPSTEPLAGIPQDLNPFTMEPNWSVKNGRIERSKLVAPSLEPQFQEGPRPMGIEYAQVPDLSAKLTPFEQSLVEAHRGNHGVLEGGKYIPMALAKPRTDMMSPEEFQQGVNILSAGKMLPEGVTPDRLTIQQPIPRTEGTALLNSYRMMATSQANDRSELNRVAQTFGYKGWDDIPTAKDKERVYNKYIQSRPQAYNSIMLNTPVTPQIGETLYDRKAFEESGELIPRPDVSERTARSKEVVRISEKNMDQLQEVEKSAVSLDAIFDFAKRIVTAKTPMEASLQSARYMANSNSVTRMVPGVYNAEMATYHDMVQALGNGLAKAFGGERGVLTNVDVSRWVNALPKPGDTAEVREKKEVALRTLAQAAYIAQRRAIAGDSGEMKKYRAEMQKTMDSVLKPLEQTETSAKPKMKPEDRYNELAKQGMKDQAIYQQMATEGY